MRSDLYTSEQVAAMLGISVRTLRERVRSKSGFIRISRKQIRFTEEHIERAMHLLEVKGEAEAVYQ